MTTHLSPSRFVSAHSIGATVQIVVDAIYSRIQNGTYVVDERLPSERTLAAELGVARNTVREALDVLETHELIRRRAGSGRFVNSETLAASAPSEIAAQSSPLDLQVIRGILEPDMVRLAVMNMPPNDIESLGETLSKMEAIQSDADQFVRLEEEFYQKLASGTGNPLIVGCYGLVIDSCRQSFRAAHLRRYLTPARIQTYQKRYNSLFNALAARDTEAAVEFIKLHLIEEQRLMLQEN
ncbi:FCD domain-containing protein [Amylibacter sp. IMCC11727]|uniref:FadR/GntR family transcriptional regulator n=1 Tax=Amylibacter sp. IMCC11727 TaxID=3039851 RepID=UPI00244E0666|nr:FCD domain-containing protein [Amylibacter sp. IMCC11727]WGI22104.1 FCD domain-containing protein [Amylibacter sp. IMCC11727]